MDFQVNRVRPRFACFFYFLFKKQDWIEKVDHHANVAVSLFFSLRAGDDCIRRLLLFAPKVNDTHSYLQSTYQLKEFTFISLLVYNRNISRNAWLYFRLLFARSWYSVDYITSPTQQKRKQVHNWFLLLLEERDFWYRRDPYLLLSTLSLSLLSNPIIPNSSVTCNMLLNFFDAFRKQDCIE